MNIKHIALCLPFLFTGCSAETHEHNADASHPGETAEVHYKCPACQMEMAEGSPITDVAGMQFMFCSDKCKEIVIKDPVKFAKDAIKH